jgi:NCS1 family nucleobase:cation symporter-1
VHAADIQPIARADQRQSTADLFLIFVGANVVATTFQVGASLAASFGLATVVVLITVGSLAGAALVAALAPLGPRLRVPSVIAARPALGFTGAGLVAAVLYVSNFAWIALNNVIAASACARAAASWFGPGAAAPGPWSVGLGLLATLVVWRGPHAVARADRIAVPLMLAVAVALTIACLRSTASDDVAPLVPMTLMRGLDVVVGYQVSWILMFADYSRYTRSAAGSAAAVFLALAATSIWMMPLGAIAARAAGTSDPGAMLQAVGLGGGGALLLTLASLTTNFVNIYMSSLAWKSLTPRASDSAVIWSIGIIGTALGALPGVWLEYYTNFMVILGAVLVPVGGVLVAHYYVADKRADDSVIPALYDAHGPYRGASAAGIIAWLAGAIVYFVMNARTSVGGTLPSLTVSIGVYVMACLSRRGGRRADPAWRRGAPAAGMRPPR